MSLDGTTFFLGLLMLIIGTVFIFVAGYLCSRKPAPQPTAKESDSLWLCAEWAKLYAREQENFDRMRSLFERQRAIEDLSEAARSLEQRAIDASFAQLCPPPPTRRSEP